MIASVTDVSKTLKKFKKNQIKLPLSLLVNLNVSARQTD